MLNQRHPTEINLAQNLLLTRSLPGFVQSERKSHCFARIASESMAVNAFDIVKCSPAQTVYRIRN